MPNQVSADRRCNRTGIFGTQSGTWLRVALVCLGPMLGLTKLVLGYPSAGGTLEYYVSRPQ